MIEEKLLEISSPIDGAIIHPPNGIKFNDGPLVDVSGKVLTSNPVYVNGMKARREGNIFTSSIVLKGKQTEIVATSGQNRDISRVILDPNQELRYSLSIDDNIFFLWDIFIRNPTSLFDNFYLRGLRDLHNKYDAKFTLNLFYEVSDRYSGTFGPFSLNQFPTEHKKEWEDNSNWLRLAFHAFNEFPNRPYQQASPERIAEDFDLVKEEIIRFAGSAYTPTSITHWAMLPRESFPSLRKRGVKTMCGYFVPNKNKVSKDDLSYDINYCFNDKISRYLSENKAIMDFESGIIFCSLDLLFNATPLNEIKPKLESIVINPRKIGVITLSTHEQYFWPQYKAPSTWFSDDPSGAMRRSPGMMMEYKHIPDHFQRLEAGIKTITENGYKPVFLNESYDL